MLTLEGLLQNILLLCGVPGEQQLHLLDVASLSQRCVCVCVCVCWCIRYLQVCVCEESCLSVQSACLLIPEGCCIRLEKTVKLLCVCVCVCVCVCESL